MNEEKAHFLVEHLRKLADQIEQWGVEEDSVQFCFDRDTVEDDPYIDEEGHSWTQWLDSGGRIICIKYKLATVKDRDGLLIDAPPASADFGKSWKSPTQEVCLTCERFERRLGLDLGEEKP